MIVGIPVLDEAPESDEMMLNDTIPDEDEVEEATQILSNVESGNRPYNRSCAYVYA